MLTSDLIRARIERSKAKKNRQPTRIIPEYLDTNSAEAIERATELIAAFERHLNDGEQNTRGALDDTIADIVGHGTDFLIWRGLAKLLLDRTEFEVISALEPLEIRRTVFEISQEMGPVTDKATRRQILQKSADMLSLSAEEVEHCLYADLDAQKRITTFKTLSPAQLLDRYNLALAQAVLYRATRLTLTIERPDPNQLRYLFQALKFRRLMHKCTRIIGGKGTRGKSTGGKSTGSQNAAEHTTSHYQIDIDGPASLFSKSRKYGLQMAMFLPAMLVCDTWRLEAELDWPGTRKGEVSEFQLTHQDGLNSPRRATGQWVAEEERYFESQFADADTAWQLTRQGSIVDLADNQVIIPDYLLTHPDGRRALVEIIGFWRKDYLARRLELLKQTPDLQAPLILVVSDRLQVDRQTLAQIPANLVFFKGVILLNKVLEAAEAISQTASKSS